MRTVTHHKTGNMKLLYLSLGIVLMIGTSCSTNRNAAQFEADDRYYSLADARRENKKLKKLNQSSPTPSSSDAVVRNENIDGYDNTEAMPLDDNQVYDYSPAPSGDDKTIVNNYYNYDPDYDMDNYYDYMYTSRLRRFHNPRRAFFNYYDPFYTNMYWYNNDPFAFGNSIYSTYNFFNPYTPWGWNTFSPGVNIGWNSWNGWNVNIGWNSWNSWNNPYAFNNPWRWNNWGYNPFMSPFAYNPYVFTPYGYGFNNYGLGYMNGFNNGLSYGLMMNTMNSNPVYYNSFDNNTFNFGNTINYGPNTGGAGNGSGFVVAPNLTSQFSQEIGMNYNPEFKGGKYGAPATNGGSKPAVSNLQSIEQPLKPSVSPVNGNVNAGSSKPGSSVQTPSKNELSNSTPGNNITKPGSQSIAPSKGEIVGGKPNVSTEGAMQAKPSQSTQPVKGENFTPSKNTVQQPVQSSSPSGKESLIQQGVVRPKADNYSSAPVQQMTKPSSDNRPETPFTRPSNVSGGVVRDLNAPTQSSPSNGNNLQTTRPSANEARPAQPYTPNYNYGNGVKGNGNNAVTRPSEPVRQPSAPSFNNDIRDNNVSRPSQQTRPNNFSPAEQPRRPETAAPVQRPATQPARPDNYAPVEQRRPETTAPVQRPNQPQQPQQQFNQPRNRTNAVVPRTEQPRTNTYQQPSRSEEPRNNYQQYQRSTQPERQPSNQNYQTPQREQRNNYSQPQPQQRNNYSQPQQRQQFDQPSRSGGTRMESAPRNSAPQRSGSFESAPKGNTGGGSMRSSGGSNNSGGRVNSPRR
jgi:hypothetical protein